MRSRVILLVEDNPDDQYLTVHALKKSVDCKVVALRDAREALDYLFRKGNFVELSNESYPAMVLLDLKLPKIGGLEVLRRIRENEATRLLPVVILTNSREEQDLCQAYRFGCNSYIRKPVAFEKFLEVLNQAANYWMTLNEPSPCAWGNGGQPDRGV